jgi:DNA polymerase sigma
MYNKAIVEKIKETLLQPTKIMPDAEGFIITSFYTNKIQ